jgi:hypothetical protein
LYPHIPTKLSDLGISRQEPNQGVIEDNRSGHAWVRDGPAEDTEKKQFVRQKEPNL